jgi:hypothetical protein
MADGSTLPVAVIAAVLALNALVDRELVFDVLKGSADVARVLSKVCIFWYAVTFASLFVIDV